ncbi:amino acid adenylation domain-containing protein [Kitasatospora sp. NPDC005751]|uniref:amino acid adenylation domain-containing protein n=1 Tax=Kitasatospora sp. NPDC005751 TaxID=3157064 RepID=UPI0033C64E77
MGWDAEPAGRAGTLHGRFEEQARQTPDAVAVRCGARELTYGELDARADRLARHLAAAGLEPGGRAAVALGRGTEVFVALLAVLKAGGAYVPLEPGAPDPLLRHVLAEADPAVVVTEESHRVRLTDAGGRAVVCVDAPAGTGEAGEAAPVGAGEKGGAVGAVGAVAATEAVTALPTGPPVVATGPDDLACVFFTSGSTGLPRGVLIEHRNLLAAYRGWRSVYGLRASDRILQTASLEFDVFTADWVRALCTGATLVVAPRNLTLDRSADIADLPALVAAEGITVLELNVRTARRLRAHLAASGGALTGVRLLTVGAEKWYLDEQLGLQGLLGAGVRVLNVYGLAEASVDSSYFDAAGATGGEGSERVSLVGRPFPGARVHVLGPDGEPAPSGTVGEIAVAGAGLGRGYLNRPEETDRRFRPAAFDPDGRVLLTGDLGRIRADGVLEFTARAEAVVGPVDSARAAAVVERVTTAAAAEGVLRSHPAVREAAVAEVEPEPGRRALVGYAVTDPGAEGADAWSLSAYLTKRLPAGDLPTAVVPLSALPRTRAGKLDRGSLPLPAPRDSTGPRAGKAGAGGSAGHKGAGFKGAGGGTGSARAAGAGGPGLSGCGWLLIALPFAFAAWLLTDSLWPGSTDLSRVPDPFASYFDALYIAEWLSFGLGAAFLLAGWPMLTAHGRPRGLTLATHLSVFWLLASWWPQDNLYRTSSPVDWSRQSLLVYVFNVALMIAAVVVVRFLAWHPPSARR